MQINKILIGIDNSTFAEHAAKYGFDLARSFNAHVGLIHIVEPAIMPLTNNIDPLLGSTMQDMGAGDVEMMDIQNQASENLIKSTIDKYAGNLQVTHFSEFGDTADIIVNCGKEFKADMIIIGTHSRTGIDRLLMGSVAEQVVRHSEVPVLVVPFPEHS